MSSDATPPVPDDGGELWGRVFIALIGVLTVFVVYKLGRLLYDRRVGLVAALLVALMPYHVIVTRQVLLDGPMTLFATIALYLLVRFVLTRRVAWLYAAGAAMGITFLSKEPGIVLIGSIYAFLALTPEVNARRKSALVSQRGSSRSLSSVFRALRVAKRARHWRMVSM